MYRHRCTYEIYLRKSDLLHIEQRLAFAPEVYLSSHCVVLTVKNIVKGAGQSKVQVGCCMDYEKNFGIYSFGLLTVHSSIGLR